MAQHIQIVDFDPSPFSTIAYRDWNNRVSLAHAIQEASETQTRAIAKASADQSKEQRRATEGLLDQGFGPLQASLARQESTLSHLPERLDQLGRTIERGDAAIISAVMWGHGGLALGLADLKSELSAKLEAVVKRLDSPSLSWVREQFRIARDNFSRGLYPDALERVRLAINGHGDNLGYREEFFFHYFMGHVRLGSRTGAKPNISDVVDPAEAEKAFLDAAYYAKSDVDRSEALFCAGRAALMQSTLDRAIEHSTRALPNSSRPALVHYQLAKCYGAEQSGTMEAASQLRRALDLEIDLLHEAWAEHAYFNRTDVLEAAFLTDTSSLRLAAPKDHYELAGCLASFEKGREKAIHYLRAALDFDLNLLRSAWEDKAHFDKYGVLDPVVSQKTEQLRGEYSDIARSFADSLAGWKAFEVAECSAAVLLNRELAGLEGVAATASVEATKAGPFDFEAALRILRGARAQLLDLPNSFRQKATAQLRVFAEFLREDHHRRHEKADEARFVAAQHDADLTRATELLDNRRRTGNHGPGVVGVCLLIVAGVIALDTSVTLRFVWALCSAGLGVLLLATMNNDQNRLERNVSRLRKITDKDNKTADRLESESRESLKPIQLELDRRQAEIGSARLPTLPAL